MNRRSPTPMYVKEQERGLRDSRIHDERSFLETAGRNSSSLSRGSCIHDEASSNK